VRPLLTAFQRELMLANGQRSADGIDNSNEFPVVKLFTPDGACTWLLTELDPEDPDIAFGLCDLGMGFPELGCVRISEIESVRGGLGLPVERDLHFLADKTLSAYANEAYRLGHLQA
jgi:hypothetical protein